MSVTQDATSGKYLPQNTTEWTELLAGSGIANPSILWLCQEASGNLADSIGTFTGTAIATLYQQAVSGWSTKALVLDAGSARYVYNADSGLPDVNTTSCMMLAWLSFPISAGADRSILTMGPTYGSQIFLNNTTSKLRGGADPNSVAGTANPYSAVHPVILQVDRTAVAANAQTDQETLSPALTSTPTGKKIWLGGDNVQTQPSAGCGYLYVAVWLGADAELDSAHRASLLSLLSSGPPIPMRPNFQLPRWGNAGGVSTIANNNPIGGIEIEHVFDIADAPSADHDITVAQQFEVTDVHAIKTGGTGTVVTVQVKNSTDAITDAMNLAMTKGGVVRCATIDPDFSVIPAGGTLRATIVRTTGNGAVRLIVRGVLRS